MSALPQPLPLEVLERSGLRRGVERSDAPTVWQLDAFNGRWTEISGGRDSAALTMTFRLVYEAQRAEEPVAWISLRSSSFFPPDVADGGIDVTALAVIWVDGALQAARVADHLLRSGGFGLIVLDLGQQARLPLRAQTRLVGLSKKHAAALLCITEKESHEPSIGSLVSLRAQARRSTADGLHRCKAEVVKDKRRGPGWSHREVCRGPDGLR